MSQNVSRVGAPRLVLPVERDAAPVRRPGVDQRAEVELLGDAPAERRDQILVAPAGGRSCAHPAAVAGRRLDVLARHRREVVGRRRTPRSRRTTCCAPPRRARRAARPTVSTRKPRPPQASRQLGVRPRRDVEQLGARAPPAGRSASRRCSPPPRSAISPWRGACAISGPVIWKAPSPHRTSGRTPMPICAPRAPGTPNPIDA